MLSTMVDKSHMLHHIRYLLHNHRSNTYIYNTVQRQARQRRRESRSVRTLQLRSPGAVAGFRRCAQSPSSVMRSIPLAPQALGWGSSGSSGVHDARGARRAQKKSPRGYPGRCAVFGLCGCFILGRSACRCPAAFGCCLGLFGFGFLPCFPVEKVKLRAIILDVP